MKRNLIYLAFILLLTGMAACNEDDNLNTTQTLDASKTAKIKKGEPVCFKFAQVPDESPVQWNVLPQRNTSVSSNGNTASVVFSNAGSYQVSAEFNNLKGASMVSVMDSVYVPVTDPEKTVPLTGDEIFISVTKQDSMGISGLNLWFASKNKYTCLNNRLLFDFTVDGANYKITFNGVFIPGKSFCEPGEVQAKSAMSLYPVTEGSHNFAVILNGKTYSGSFTKSGSTYTFTWPYANGVYISPSVIK